MNKMVLIYLDDFGVGAGGCQIERSAAVLIDAVDAGALIEQRRYGQSMSSQTGPAQRWNTFLIR